MILNFNQTIKESIHEQVRSLTQFYIRSPLQSGWRLFLPKKFEVCDSDFQVGELSSVIDYKSLIGFDDYQQQLYKRYPKNAWLTPSEIFKPYYGMSLGNYIQQAQQRYLRTHPGKRPIRIVEAGAGTGSAAQSILYFFQNHSQQLFKDIEYHIVEISPVLCEHITRKLKKSFPRLLQKGQIKILNKDIMKYTNPERCYTVFLEVLDNLPHDKIIQNQKGVYDKYSVVNLDTNQEKYQHVSNDKIIKECLELYLKAEKFKQNNTQNNKKGFLDWAASKILQKYYVKKSNSNQLFLPTGMYKLMQDIKKNMPEAHLIMSDFDSLVSKIPGINAPIVSYKGQQSPEKKDYDTYLVERGAADIFFPVDFHFLKYLHGVILGEQADVLKSYDFFQEFQVQNWTSSKSGFNPLKQDFSNTSFLVTKL